jgi:SAM-dependent methyltransferase
VAGGDGLIGAMSWLMATLYDRFMSGMEEACGRAWRAELLGGLAGEVLEVGAGTGINLPHYPPEVTRLVLAEPDVHMRKQLAAKVASSPRRSAVEILPFGLGAPEIDRSAGSFDAVVSTLVLCTVPDPDAALRSIRLLLRSGGKLVFLEHVAADDNPSRLRWQRRIEPLWKHVAGGCHLCRRTAESIEAAGLQISECRRESARKALPIVRTTIRGFAVKP